MNKTKIEWCDFTWNPIVGCRNGCEYCYARRIATTRLKRLCEKCGTFTPHLHYDRLGQPWHVKKPALIFADSMSDWWSKGMQEEWRDKAMWMMLESTWHKFVVLTKQPERITPLEAANWPSNAWLGVSVTSGADWWRWEALAKLPERIHKFVSVEPLLGPGVGGLMGLALNEPLPEWVIVGPQSGPGAEPVEAWYQTTIRWGCEQRGRHIPLFEKSGLPLQPAIRQMPPDLAAVFRKEL